MAHFTQVKIPGLDITDSPSAEPSFQPTSPPAASGSHYGRVAREDESVSVQVETGSEQMEEETEANLRARLLESLEKRKRQQALKASEVI